jgi:DNA repair exonuclease SbcCD ATPase subunit
MFDVRARIEELETRRKELIMQAHNLRDAIERAESYREQMKQTEKELSWLAGALDALKVWEQEAAASKIDQPEAAKPYAA